MSEITEAAERRAEAAEQRRDNYIAGLETERRGYVQRELDSRIKQVDDQIAYVKKARFNASGPAEADPEVDATAAKVTDAAAAAELPANEAGTAPTPPAAEKPAATKPTAKPTAAKPAAKSTAKPAGKPTATAASK